MVILNRSRGIVFFAATFFAATVFAAGVLGGVVLVGRIRFLFCGHFAMGLIRDWPGWLEDWFVEQAWAESRFGNGDGNGMDFYLDSVTGVSMAALHWIGFCLVLDKVPKVVNI